MQDARDDGFSWDCAVSVAELNPMTSYFRWLDGCNELAMCNSRLSPEHQLLRMPWGRPGPARAHASAELKMAPSLNLAQMPAAAPLAA
jgi:hypothetical protein